MRPEVDLVDEKELRGGAGTDVGRPRTETLIVRVDDVVTDSGYGDLLLPVSSDDLRGLYMDAANADGPVILALTGFVCPAAGTGRNVGVAGRLDKARELESALSLPPRIDGDSSVPVRDSREGGRLEIPLGRGV